MTLWVEYQLKVEILRFLQYLDWSYLVPSSNIEQNERKAKNSWISRRSYPMNPTIRYNTHRHPQFLYFRSRGTSSKSWVSELASQVSSTVEASLIESQVGFIIQKLLHEVFNSWRRLYHSRDIAVSFCSIWSSRFFFSLIVKVPSISTRLLSKK